MCIASAVGCGQHLRRVWGSASIQILYTYVMSSGDIRYDNQSYAIVIQQKSYARRRISAPSVPTGLTKFT